MNITKFNPSISRVATLCLAVGVLAFAGAGSAYSDVIYRENFGNNINSVQETSLVGWNANQSSSGTVVTGTSAVLVASAQSPNGKPTDLGNVNAGTSLSNVTGYMVVGGAVATAPVLVWTNEYTIDRSQYEITQFSFYSANNLATVGYQFAVQIGGSWYVTSSTFTQTGTAGTMGAGQLLSFSFTSDASAWRDLNFVSGSSLLVGSLLSSPLPGGNMTAFGLYVANDGNDVNRFDTYQIDGSVIPEPTMFGLLGLGALTGVILVRRRRKS